VREEDKNRIAWALHDGVIRTSYRARSASRPELTFLKPARAFPASNPWRQAPPQETDMVGSNAKRPVRIILADDHDLVRAGIRKLLDRIDGVQVIAEAKDGQELVALVENSPPDLVITDLSMPRMDGFEAITRIRALHPALPIVALSMNDTAVHVKRAVKCGASGYLMKDAAVFDLEQAVFGVVRHGHYFPSSVAGLLLRPAAPTAADVLTPRQVQILSQVARGNCSKQIAFNLGLSSKTVDVHRARIMERLNLNDIASLTRYAVREGLVAT
jgi:DNA-binding NarL/FixJ family response regulator